MSEKEIKEIEGEISFIGPIRDLGGNLKSIGIRLKNIDQWFNIAEFSETHIKTILGETKVGDKIKLILEQRGAYWNITQIKHLEVIKGEIIEIEKPLEEFEKPKAELAEAYEKGIEFTLEEKVDMLLKEVNLTKELVLSLAEKLIPEELEPKKASI